MLKDGGISEGLNRNLDFLFVVMFFLSAQTFIRRDFRFFLSWVRCSDRDVISMTASIRVHPLSAVGFMERWTY